MRDPFLEAAIEQARKSYSEGGIPIGSVLYTKVASSAVDTIAGFNPAARSITAR